MSKIVEMLAELEKLEAEYVDAETATQAARRKETDALNRLNKLQQEIDTEMATIKNDSPGGDWTRRKRG